MRAMQLDGIEPGKLTYVDFQVRPQDPEHLWFAHHVLDWPEDREAQIQEGDGGTWADIAREEGRSAEAGEANGEPTANERRSLKKKIGRKEFSTERWR